MDDSPSPALHGREMGEGLRLELPVDPAQSPHMLGAQEMVVEWRKKQLKAGSLSVRLVQGWNGSLRH